MRPLTYRAMMFSLFPLAGMLAINIDLNEGILIITTYIEMLIYNSYYDVLLVSYTSYICMIV